ncbi:unnamed protein product [Phytophthora fragariaefolia]|uniref:Unnamed protein product n=1 Tax=Phytophthora fragariaefolia TaxID=1490495 RepID=A0A9W6Y412_9STRA|nr:unnamed protein product [Phytophthora fragariaefolia]
MLLRMYNEASTSRECNKLEAPDCQDNNCEEKDSNTTLSATSLMSSSTVYAAELEGLIRAEQLNRIALIKQITSEREQANVHQLIYDAVIGRQLVETTLEEEVAICEKDFDASYRKVLETLRNKTIALPSSTDNSGAQEQKINAIFDAMGGNECSDEILRIETIEELRAVFDDYRRDVAQFEKEFVNAASTTDAASSFELATSKCGGWSDIDEERFLKVLRNYEKKHGTGTKPQLLYDQLALVLPMIPLLEIKKHIRFHQHLRFYHDKRKDRQRELQRRLEKLQAEATTKFRIASEQEHEKIKKLQQLSEMKEQCEQRHDLVSQWRVTKEAKERIEKQQREIEEIMEVQQQQKEALRWKRRHDQQKITVDEYKYARLNLNSLVRFWC